MSILRVAIATAYICQSVCLSVLVACSANKELTLKLSRPPLSLDLLMIEFWCSGLTQFPLHAIALEMFIIKVVNILTGFSFFLARIAYIFNILSMIGLFVLFISGAQEKPIFENAIRRITSNISKSKLKSFTSINNINYFLNPLCLPGDDIRVFPNITYATNEESAHALSSSNNDFNQPRKMMLDVYASANPKKNGLRPVLVHVHGGGWHFGTKNFFYPHEKILVTEDDWVVVNIGYRLSPKNAYPTHLLDVKRAIRWIKRNISSFGGDPSFVVLSGDSAGAHLAAMAGLTANDPDFQKGFEDVDTSVKGVISLSGALDIHGHARVSKFFSERVALLDKHDPEFTAKNSPAEILCQKKEGDLISFLLFAGEKDALVESSHSKVFKSNFDKVVDQGKRNVPRCDLVVLPSLRHVYYLGWSPRSLYGAKVIQAWCQEISKQDEEQ